MELLMAIGIGALTTAGVYLVLRAHTFAVILGLTLLSYAVNLFVFASGGIKVGAPPRIAPGASDYPGAAGYAEPLAQALVLTAIVISFAMTALAVALALRARVETGDDALEPDLGPEDR